MDDMAFTGFGNMFPNLPFRGFKSTYRCYSVSMMPGQSREDVDKGGKIIMPPSALDSLTRLNIQYPMLFKLINNKTHRETHCGVLEFVADEGRIYLPYWMMRNLLIEEGGLVQVESVSLPVATFTKFQPQSLDFLDISNPKAVLENALRSFACLTTGDVIAIKYNEKQYELCVLESKPGKAVTIIECDMNVDFAAPVGYKEDNNVQKDVNDECDEVPDYSQALEDNTFRAFSGSGNRLDGKKRNMNSESESSLLPSMNQQRGIPNYNHTKGKITFIRQSRVSNGDTAQDTKDYFEAFSGAGQALRKKKLPP